MCLSRHFHQIQARGPGNTHIVLTELAKGAVLTRPPRREVLGNWSGPAVGMGADNAGIHTWRETKRRGLIAGIPPRPGNP